MNFQFYLKIQFIRSKTSYKCKDIDSNANYDPLQNLIFLQFWFFTYVNFPKIAIFELENSSS